jgi:hypothetical protein
VARVAAKPTRYRLGPGPANRRRAGRRLRSPSAGPAPTLRSPRRGNLRPPSGAHPPQPRAPAPQGWGTCTPPSDAHLPQPQAHPHRRHVGEPAPRHPMPTFPNPRRTRTAPPRWGTCAPPSDAASSPTPGAPAPHRHVGEPAPRHPMPTFPNPARWGGRRAAWRSGGRRGGAARGGRVVSAAGHRRAGWPAGDRRAIVQQQRHPGEVVALPQRALQVAQVPVGEPPVGEQHEPRRCDLGLGGVAQLELLVAPTRRGVARDHLVEQRVELPGRDPTAVVVPHGLQLGQEPADAAAGLGGHVDPRRPGGEGQQPVQLTLEVAAALLVDQVPLVADQHDPATGFAQQGRQPLVLLPERFGGVDHEQDQVGVLDRGAGAVHRVQLGVLARR